MLYPFFLFTWPICKFSLYTPIKTLVISNKQIFIVYFEVQQQKQIKPSYPISPFLNWQIILPLIDLAQKTSIWHPELLKTDQTFLLLLEISWDFPNDKDQLNEKYFTSNISQLLVLLHQFFLYKLYNFHRCSNAHFSAKITTAFSTFLTT